LVSILLFISADALAFSITSTEVNGIPYIISNSTYGIYYGLIGKENNALGQMESLTLSTYLMGDGGNGATFIFSLPDGNYRKGKEYGFAFDLSGAIGLNINERYYGLGSYSNGDKYSTFNNDHSKLIFQFSRTLQKEILVEGDVFFASNKFSNIHKGIAVVTGEVEDNCRDYTGISLKLSYDGRDQSLDPHNGIYIITDLDYGISVAEYSKAYIDARAYQTPFDPSQVFALRGMLTQMSGRVIPIYEYATLGGGNTLRGYAQNRFRDTNSALLNAEYRVPTPLPWAFFSGLSTVFFLEGGSVDDEMGTILTSKWAVDSGFGFHLNLGGNVIVRADIGFGAEGVNAYFFYDQAF
jgi:outer membrane protein assembly factor BamA